MNKSILVFLLFVASVCKAQVTSSTYRDASGGGPYPFYIGVGYANTSIHDDYKRINNAFHENNNAAFDNKNRLRGVEVLAGFSFKPEGSKFPPIPIVVEFRYMHLTKNTKVDDMSFSMAINQLSAGLGVRYAMFPIVVQIQAGPILSYREEFATSLRGGSAKRRITNKSNPAFGFNGFSGIFRVGILDPAGTEGGLGFYIEIGYHAPKTTNNIDQVIMTFDPQYDSIEERKSSYTQFSAGFLFPLAIKVK